MTAGLNDAALAARDARASLGVGLEAPLPDILKLVEEAGAVPVAVLAMPRRLASAYAVKDDRPFIFLNGVHDPAEQRFFLAHAFGHHRLGHGDVIDFVDSVLDTPHDPKERAANEFAMEFLAPEPAVSRTLHGWRVKDVDVEESPETVARLASYFGLNEFQALSTLHRMDRLRPRGVDNILGFDKRSLVFALPRVQPPTAAYSRAPDELWAALETPMDTIAAAQSRLPRLPATMQLNALKAYGKGLMPLGRVADALGQDTATTEEWLASAGVTPPPEPADY